MASSGLVSTPCLHPGLQIAWNSAACLTSGCKSSVQISHTELLSCKAIPFVKAVLINQENTEHQRKHTINWADYHSPSGKSIIHNIKQYWHHQRQGSTPPVISAIKGNEPIGTWVLQGLLCSSKSVCKHLEIVLKLGIFHALKVKLQNLRMGVEFVTPT